MLRIHTLLIAIAIAFLFQPMVFAADQKPKRLTIATWNLEWFYDAQQSDNQSKLSREKSAPSEAEWNWKLDQVARVINEIDPTILALQEVENRLVLEALTKKLNSKYRKYFRIAYIRGSDTFTEQDVAIIYRSGLVHYRRHERSEDIRDNKKEYYNLTKHLVGKFEWGKGKDKEELTVVTAHLRARADAEDIRKKQARLLHEWIGEELIGGENVVVLGDFNTEEDAGHVGKQSDMAVLLGHDTKTTEDDLFDLNRNINEGYRETHVSGGQFDRIMASRSMLEDERRKKGDLVFSQIRTAMSLVVRGERDRGRYYEIPRNERDISDHCPVVADFLFK